MRVGLNARMLAASMLVAAIVAGTFVALLLAISGLRDASRQAQRSDQITAAANQLERSAIDLETGERGYVITGQQRFLKPWETARSVIPAQERELGSLVRDASLRQDERAVVLAVGGYIRTWSIPMVALASTDRAAAAHRTTSGVGKAKMDHVRALFAGFLLRNGQLSTSRAASATAAGSRAVLVGVLGLLGSALLILFAGGYLAKAVVAPVRRLAGAAARLEEGDLSARVPDVGHTEIAELARTFNRMASSLEDNQAELKQSLRQQQEANDELDAFSYSVSHDLRAPLRAIDGFSRLLIDEYTDDLPADGRRYVGLVRRNTQQMGRLIDGLLSFSRLGQQQLSKRTVVVQQLAAEVVIDAEHQQNGRVIEISVGTLPPALADPMLVTQVLANLLSNAIKYTGEREVARIEIGSDQQMGHAVYFVRDNGVGFDMRHADKLFQVFQRLHRAEDYDGTGLGLALVARIVKRHGGKVWAEATPNEGATFYFTLEGR
jgi:signal transduction histidine kinase